MEKTVQVNMSIITERLADSREFDNSKIKMHTKKEPTRAHLLANQRKSHHYLYSLRANLAA